MTHDVTPRTPAPTEPSRPRITNGSQLSDGNGTVYVVSNLRERLVGFRGKDDPIVDAALTLTRAIPKVRGKARLKALKRQRQRLQFGR